MIGQQHQEIAEDFLKELSKGRVCLHPTDTLPGLTCDPRNKKAVQKILDIKGYANDRPFIHLCAKSDDALRFLANVPAPWHKTLSTLWPSPLSVVWQSREAFASTGEISGDTIAIRVPILLEEIAWLQIVMQKLALPLPSTSVNKKGLPAATHWDEASTFLKEYDVYIPPKEAFGQARQTQASTLIEILDNGDYQLLRQGAYPKSKLDLLKELN